MARTVTRWRWWSPASDQAQRIFLAQYLCVAVGQGLADVVRESRAVQDVECLLQRLQVNPR